MRWWAAVMLVVVAGIGTLACSGIDAFADDAAFDETPFAGPPPEPGPSAYGWQSCRRGEPDETFPMDEFHFRQHEAAGWFDPEQQSGQIVTRLLEGSPREAIVVDGVTVEGNWQSVDYLGPGPLRTVSGILALFDPDQTVVDPVDGGRSVPVVEILDAGADGPTVAVEGLPQGWFNRAASERLEGYRPVTSVLDERPPVLWRLEAWADDDGNVDRVRYQTQDHGPMVVELRFLPASEVQAVNGSLRLPTCPPGLDGAQGWRGFEAWDTDRRVPLQVSLDPSGNPYELIVDPGTTTRREAIGSLDVPSLELLVMDGSAVEVDPSYFRDEASTIPLTSTDRVDGLYRIPLEVIWEVNSRGVENVLGIWVGPSDAPVLQWSPFELAYGTGGGVGAVLSESVVDAAAASVVPGEYFVPDRQYDVIFQFLDLDGLPGDDTLIFSNGFGDGSYPMSLGLDTERDVVAAVIWRADVPWRLAFPGAVPPQDVVDREADMQACLAGRRPVLPTGYCPFDDELATWRQAE